jgi:hypothetical protein
VAKITIQYSSSDVHACPTKDWSDMRKIVEADILSDRKRMVNITLSTGQVISGFSLGIMPAVDDEGEELDYDVLAFEAVSPQAFFRLKDEDIDSVENVTYSE